MRTDLKHSADRLVSEQVAEDCDPAGEADASDQAQRLAAHPLHGMADGTSMAGQSGLVRWMAIGDTVTRLMSCLSVRLIWSVSGVPALSFHHSGATCGSGTALMSDGVVERGTEGADEDEDDESAASCDV